MMKRYLLIMILGFTWFLSLSAQTELNFYSSNNQPERKAVIRYLLDSFELYNSDIKVNLHEYNENEPIDIVLGDSGSISPDIIMADSRLLHRISQKGKLNYDFTKNLISNLGQDNFYSGSLSSLSFNNNFMAIPYSAWLQVIWYRKDWFQNASLKRPDSLERIKRAAEYFTEVGENKYGIILGTNDEVYTEQCFLQFAEPSGFNLLQSDNRWVVDGRKLLDSLRYYDQLKEFTPKGGINWRARDYYFQDQASMLVYSTHLMDDLAIKDIARNSLTGDNFSDLDGSDYTSYLLRNTGMVTSIDGEKTTSFGSVSGLGIFNSTDSDILEAQKKLVEFLYREDVYITWLHMSPGGMLPTYKPVLQNDNFFRDPSGVFKRYGRDTIISLTEGIENLALLNTEILAENDYNEYPEAGLQHLVYQWINSKDKVNFDKIWIIK